jgi:hypothetical protein
MLNFKYEDGFKIKNKYFPAISMVLYLSNKTIRRPPQSHETIPLRLLIDGSMYSAAPAPDKNAAP